MIFLTAKKQFLLLNLKVEGVSKMIKNVLLSCVGIAFAILAGVGIYFNFISVG